MIFCDYGCGQEAKYQFKNGKWCCNKFYQSCSFIRKRTSNFLNILEVKEKYSESQKLSQNKSEVNCKRSKSLKATLAKGEVKENHKRAVKEGWEKPGRKSKRSELMKEIWNRPGMREKISSLISESMKEVCKRPEEIERRRQYMLNGGSSYITSFVKYYSNEELKLREIIKELFPEAKATFKVLENRNYKVDIALTNYKIAIEYDGWHHFKDEKSIIYHRTRQEEIESDGWIFIRYNIFQKFPNKEGIKEDILRAMKERTC
jgi:very-short-patch-repair endonuclease